jgi:hypothetical protein
VEWVRRQLEGTWTLRSFAILLNDVPLSVSAWGDLTCDRFGNVRVRGVILEPVQSAAFGRQHSPLEYSGRVVIDAGRGEMWLEDAPAISPLSGETREPLSPSHVGRFVLEGDSLALTFMATEDGPAVALAVFTRAASVR